MSLFSMVKSGKSFQLQKTQARPSVTSCSLFTNGLFMSLSNSVPDNYSSGF